ncbi:MAG: type IV pilus assembly protein PilM [Planctomycetes bacterium]|nr:type IV pilus assembly protein PilM [Planctomycetota bacterium]
MAKSAWGIEIGSSSVKAVKLSGDGGSVMLDAYTIISLADFGLGGGTSKEEATAGALAELRTSQGIKKGEQVFVSLSAQNTLGRIISLPPVPKDRVRETIQNEARSQLPIKLEEAVWDYQIIDDDNADGEMKVNLYAAKREVVDQLLSTCDDAGLDVTGVQVAPLGIYNFVKFEFDDAVAECCVAIDIGAENTDLVIIDGQKTYVRVVPVAGKDITKALRARFKLDEEKAEQLKRNAAKSKDAAAVFEAMKAPLKDMVGEIYRAVGFYKNQNEAAKIDKLVMMGNGSKLLNIKKFFEQQLQFEIFKVEAPQRITVARSLDAAEVEGSLQSLTVAIGLALQGLGAHAVNSINLIPAEYLQNKGRAKLRTPFFVGGALAAAGGALALVLSVLSTGGIDTVLTDAKNTQDAASKRSADVKKNKDLGADELKARSLQNLAEGLLARISQKGKDEDGNAIDLPPREVRIQANAVPGIIARAMEEALAQAAEKSTIQIYRANQTTGGRGAGGSSLQSSACTLSVENSGTTMAKEAGGPVVYEATRKFKYVANVATRGVAADAASANLSKLLRSDKLLDNAVRKELLGYLAASGQLQGMDKAAIEKLNLEKDFQIVLAVQLGPPKTFSITDLVRDASWIAKGGRTDPAVRGMEIKDTFALTTVQLELTLNPVAPAPEAAATEEAGK